MRRTCLISLLVAASCMGTDIGNPVVDLDFSLYGDRFPPDGAAARGLWANGMVELDEAWISVERVRLRGAADCSGGAELELVGPYYVDLLAVGPPVGLADIAVPEVSYCRFEARWDAAEGTLPAGVPAQLAGASIFIGGTTAAGTPFEVRTRRNDELRLDAVDGAGFPINAATHALFVAFDGAALFSGIDLDAATVGNDGIIHIEDGSNDGLLATFDDNLQAATRLFDDDDGSGTLDPPERDVGDALAE